jgi:hypothetical protein
MLFIAGWPDSLTLNKKVSAATILSLWSDLVEPNN